ncbi:MAG: TlpA family protein disulfide reductase [Candidatus Dormibacteria bacterium]
MGQKAPQFQGTDLDGKQLGLAAFSGKPVLLNFWASWCGPCRAEQPGLDRLARDYSGRLQVLGIDVRDNNQQARIYRDEFKVPYPSLYDQAARLEFAYTVDAPPSTVLIDSSGTVVFRVTGGLSEADLRQLVQDKLLKG